MSSTSTLVPSAGVPPTCIGSLKRWSSASTWPPLTVQTNSVFARVTIFLTRPRGRGNRERISTSTWSPLSAPLSFSGKISISSLPVSQGKYPVPLRVTCTMPDMCFFSVLPLFLVTCCALYHMCATVSPMLTIRLTRVGKKKDGSFRVIVVESKRKVQPGNYLEMVGSYDPRVDTVSLKADRIKYWMSMGATVSDTVHNLLVSQKIIDPKKINVLPKKTVPKKEAVKEEAKAEVKSEVKEEAVSTEVAAEVPADTIAE